jgi:hypothetical protein
VRIRPSRDLPRQGKEQNRTAHRTAPAQEQHRTAQNRTEQNRTEQNGTEQKDRKNGKKERTEGRKKPAQTISFAYVRIHFCSSSLMQLKGVASLADSSNRLSYVVAWLSCLVEQWEDRYFVTLERS